MPKAKHPCTDPRCQCPRCARDSDTCCLNRPKICPEFSDYDPNYVCPNFTPENEEDNNENPV